LRRSSVFRFVLGCFPLFLIFSGCPQKEEKTDVAPEAAPAVSPTGTKPDLAPEDLLPGAWESDVKNNLIKLVMARGEGGTKYDPKNPPVAVFDFDNTCIRGDIGRAFYDYMVTERKILFNDEIFEALPGDKRNSIKAAWKKLQKLPHEKQADSVELQTFRKLMHQAYWSLCYNTPPEKCFPWQVRFYAGYTPEEIRSMAEEVMTSELGKPLGSEPIKAGPEDEAPAITSTGIRIHKEMQSLIALLQKKGFQVWIISAGPEWVVEGAAKHFRVKPDRVIGMRAKLQDGKLTSQIEPPPTFRQGKVDAIEKYIGKKPLLAVGDSWTDAEMLEYVQHALLIDRGYEDLKKKAVESGWWIQPAFPVD
jgi:phosphoserine phosphatase